MANPYYTAQDILSRRNHSEHEMRYKLKRKHFSSQQINDTIDKLKQRNLINDAEFAALYIVSTLRHKAVGPRWLNNKLRQKGIDSTTISLAIEETLHDTQEQELIKQAATKWQALHSKHATDKTRLTRFLLSRGFTPATIREII